MFDPVCPNCEYDRYIIITPENGMKSPWPTHTIPTRMIKLHCCLGCGTVYVPSEKLRDINKHLIEMKEK